MAGHGIGTREEWLAAREDLLKREKEHTRHGDEIARLRRDLPWVPWRRTTASRRTTARPGRRRSLSTC
jgi:predicted dithiol-disulfide oxidoreductase (DUF899 family)